jgi:hypothetical protein
MPPKLKEVHVPRICSSLKCQVFGRDDRMNGDPIASILECADCGSETPEWPSTCTCFGTWQPV